MSQKAFSLLGGAFVVLALTACAPHRSVDEAVTPQTAQAGSVQSRASGDASGLFVARGNEPFWTIKATGAYPLPAKGQLPQLVPITITVGG